MSAMYTSPFGAIATSLGMLRNALMAGPPSPTDSPSPGRAGARDGVDEPGRVIDHADPVVQRVGDVDVAVAGGCHRARRVQLRRRRRAVVARIAVLVRTGDGDDLAGFAIDPADPVVVRIGDDEVAVGRDGDTVRRVQLRTRWPDRNRPRSRRPANCCRRRSRCCDWPRRCGG